MLEIAQRFSESSIWQRQRDYFEKMGMEAWQKGIIPHYITTNPYIANSYSEILLGFLRDVSLNHNEPLYVIELGAGSGRLGHHFLQRFLPLLDLSPFPDLKTCYVLTDFPKKTVDAWSDNETLKDWMAQGRLDYAQFDLENPDNLNLRYSQKMLNPTTLANPLVLLANYVFDSIPQDLFWVEHGKLEEYRVAVTWSSQTDEHDWSSDADLDFSKHAIPTDYYDLPELNAILKTYQESLQKTVVSLPTKSISALDYFCSNSNQSRLILCADKGYNSFEDLDYRMLPTLTSHGSFSLSLNFDAIQRFVKLRQGHVLQPTQQHTYLHVNAFAWNSSIQETRLAFYQAINNRGPDEFFILKSALQEHYEDLNFVQVLAWLRWSGWDFSIFLRIFDRLMVLLNEINSVEQDELFVGLNGIWENYLSIGQEEDVAYCLGMVSFELGAYTDALDYYQYSLDHYGTDLNILNNMGICHFELGQGAQARRFFEQTLKQDAQFQPARDMLKMLENSDEE